MWFARKPAIAMGMALFTLLILSEAAGADSDWMERAGTVSNALTLQDGSHVYLDAEDVSKIRWDQNPAYIVISEFFSQNQRIAVITQPSGLLRCGELVDIAGDMTTLGDGSRAIINAVVYGYADSDGNLLYYGPLLKGLYAPLPWDWMIDLTVYPAQTPGSAYMQPADDEDPPGGGGIDTSGVQIYQTSTIADAVAQPLGTVIELCGKPIASVETGELTIAEDDTTDTLQIAYSNATSVDTTYRVASVLGTLDTDGTNPVLDVDSGPNYDVQESYPGSFVFTAAGTIANAKTYPDGSAISLGTTTAGEIVTRAWQDSFYVEEDDRTCGIEVQMTAHGLNAESALISRARFKPMPPRTSATSPQARRALPVPVRSQRLE